MNGIRPLVAGCLLLLPVILHAQEEPPAAPAPQPAQGVVYVNDQLYINVRATPDPASETLSVIPSGTRMEVLEREEGGEGVRVRLESGVQGWVLKRYLADQPIARDRIAGVERRAEELGRERDQLRQSLATESGARKRLEGANRELERQIQTLGAELKEIKTLSTDAVAAHDENRALKQRLEVEAKEIAAQRDELGALRARQYLLGIAALVVGLVVGFYIGYSPVRRDKSWRRLP